LFYGKQGVVRDFGRLTAIAEPPKIKAEAA
jgi:hypothetical protein